MPITLEDFVAETLSQIIRGVQKAQDAVAGTGAMVSPQMQSLSTKDTIGQALGGHSTQPVYNVDFAIAVTVSEKAASSGGLAFIIGVVTAGAHAKSEQDAGSTSRIRFSVPIVLPYREVSPKGE